MMGDPSTYISPIRLLNIADTIKQDKRLFLQPIKYGLVTCGNASPSDPLNSIQMLWMIDTMSEIHIIYTAGLFVLAEYEKMFNVPSEDSIFNQGDYQLDGLYIDMFANIFNGVLFENPEEELFRQKIYGYVIWNLTQRNLHLLFQ